MGNQQNPVKISEELLITKAYKLQSKTALNHERIYVQEHFPLLQNVVEHIVISHGGHVDMKTQAKLHDIHIKLEKVTNRLCQL